MSNNTTQSQVTAALTEAIQTISQSAAASKAATLTVKAEITEVVDEGLGIYQVTYLGNTFEASTTHSEIIYSVGDLVYVIIPNGNFDETKLILSPVNSESTVYASTVNGEYYVSLGDNLFKSIDDVELNSFIPLDDTSVVIDRTGFSALFNSALKDSRTFNFTCKIRTEIPNNHRSEGNYGLKLSIPVIQQVDDIYIEDYYDIILDKNNISGDMYNLTVPALQNIYFTLPEDLIYDNSRNVNVYKFCKGFLGEDDTQSDDIFINDIQLLSIYAIPASVETGYSAVVTATEGYSFLTSRTGDKKTLSVTAYLNGKVTQLDKFDCYWFKENSYVDTSSDKFNRFGGIGWEILNDYNEKELMDNGKISYQYITNNYSLVVNQEEIHSDTRFKCVLVCGESVVKTIVTIKNLASDASISLTTSTGSSYYPVNVGNVELVLTYAESGITDVDSPDFCLSFNWQRFDKNNNYIDNDFYEIKEYEKIDNKYVMKISYPVSKIEDTNTISCSVNIENSTAAGVVKTVVGTKFITISTIEKTGNRIILTNSDRIYKYDADGDSPMSANYDGPLSSAIKTIDPIEVKLYDAEGAEFTSDMYSVMTVTWLVPINSMIRIASSLQGDTTSNPGYYTISGNYVDYGKLEYTISSSYLKTKNDNDIIVRVAGPSNAFNEGFPQSITSLKFIKDGASGTNGSKYSAIVAYGGYGYGEKDSEGKVHKLQLVYVASASNWYIYNPATSNILTPFNTINLTAKLYVNGELSSSSPNTAWKIFDSSYSTDTFISPVNIGSGGVITLNGNKWTDTSKHFGATIEAKVSVGNNGQTNSREYVYTYYPIECSYINSLSNAEGGIPTLQGGFTEVVYAPDGTNPQQDNSDSFEVIDINYWEDLSEVITCTWSVSSNLDKKSEDANKCEIKPKTKYDNGVAKNFVRVSISRSDGQLSKLEDLRDELQADNIQYQNKINYFSTLQDYLAIFENFEYNKYIEDISSIADYYNEKTSLVKTMEELNKQIVNLRNRCNQYLYTESGFLDNNIQRVLSETLDKIEELSKLTNYCYQLGTSDSALKKIIAAAPSSLLINNKIGTVENFRSCYFTINDIIDQYNATVNSVYGNYYNVVVGMSAEDAIAYGFYNEINSFVNSPSLDALGESYYGINEESYRYTGLSEILKKYVLGLGEKTDTYSYSYIIENVIKPMYSTLKWYINFERNGGYYSKILELADEQFDVQDKINYLNKMINAGTSFTLIHVKPIIMLYNRYSMSNLNGWDGNKLETGDGYLIAPQVGAGKKEQDNSFTGIVMGIKQVSENSISGQKIGLFGYSSGAQSIFLNAEDGSATFGVSGKGQILIQPTSDKALIKSGNYSTTAKTGMQIDLTTPEIRYGSGNFVVDKDGHATIKGGGDIAGWKIGETQIYSNVTPANGRLTLDSSGSGKIYSHSHSALDNTGVGFYLAQDGLSIGNSIRMSAANNGSVLIGRLTGSRYWTINGDANNSYIAFGTKGQDKSVYIGTDSISLGTKFSVTNAGALTARSGSVGGWTIGDTSLSSTGITINSNGSINGDGTGGGWWSIDRGKATFNNIEAKGGSIGGWSIETNALSAAGIIISSNGNISGDGNGGGAWSINRGSASFNYISANGGTIAGWNINGSELSNNGISLNSGGYISGTGFSLNSSGLSVTNPNGGSSLNWGTRFSVGTDGTLRAKNAIIEGNISAKDGSIGGWKIDSTGLTADEGITYIRPNSIAAKDIRSTENIYYNYGGIGEHNLYEDISQLQARVSALESNKVDKGPYNGTISGSADKTTGAVTGECTINFN